MSAADPVPATTVKKYLCNVRFTVSLLRVPFFVVFAVGNDLRKGEIGELAPGQSNRRHESPLKVTFFFLTGLIWALFSVIVLTFIVLYIAKSQGGIDLVQGESPFPNFLKQIGLCH